MIDEKKLAELQNHWKGFPSKLNGNITTEDIVEMMYTIETLLKENTELKRQLEEYTTIPTDITTDCENCDGCVQGFGCEYPVVGC